MQNRKWIFPVAAMLVGGTGMMFAAQAIAGGFVAGGETRFDPFNPVRESTAPVSPAPAASSVPIVGGLTAGSNATGMVSAPISRVGGVPVEGGTGTVGRTPIRDPFRPPTRSPYVP